jgi:hypothetical protein
LVAFVESKRLREQDGYAAWVSDHDRPGALVNVHDAVFVASDRIKAPMNGGLAAFASRASASRSLAGWGGLVESWTDVTKRVQR